MELPLQHGGCGKEEMRAAAGSVGSRHVRRRGDEFGHWILYLMVQISLGLGFQDLEGLEG